MALTVLPHISLAALLFYVGPRYPAWSATNSVQQQGAAALLAVRVLNEKFGHLFNFSFSFLPDDGTIAEFPTMEFDAADMTGRFYFGHDGHGNAETRQPNSVALLSPCKSFSVNI